MHSPSDGWLTMTRMLLGWAGLGITATDGVLYPRVEARIQPGGDVLSSADIDHRFMTSAAAGRTWTVSRSVLLSRCTGAGIDEFRAAASSCLHYTPPSRHYLRKERGQ